MIAIDTNLLVYAHRSLCPEHQRAKKAIEEAASSRSGWGIALPSISVFWTVVTHPSCEGGPSTSTQAADFLASLFETGSPAIFIPNDSFAERLVKTAVNLNVQGVRIYDLQIALMASDGGATELWTHDSGFIKISGIALHDPLGSY